MLLLTYHALRSTGFRVYVISVQHEKHSLSYWSWTERAFWYLKGTQTPWWPLSVVPWLFTKLWKELSFLCIHPPLPLSPSYNANLTLTTHCMSLKEQCSHSVHSANIWGKVYKLNAGGFLFKLADYFCKTQSRIPKDNSFGHWRGLMEFGQFVGQLRLNLLMDLMRGGVETKLMYRHRIFHLYEDWLLTHMKRIWLLGSYRKKGLPPRLSSRYGCFACVWKTPGCTRC